MRRRLSRKRSFALIVLERVLEVAARVSPGDRVVCFVSYCEVQMGLGAYYEVNAAMRRRRNKVYAETATPLPIAVVVTTEMRARLGCCARWHGCRIPLDALPPIDRLRTGPTYISLNCCASSMQALNSVQRPFFSMNFVVCNLQTPFRAHPLL